MERTPDLMHKFVQSMNDANLPKIKEMVFGSLSTRVIILLYHTNTNIILVHFIFFHTFSTRT